MTRKEFSKRLAEMVKSAISTMGNDAASLFDVDTYMEETEEKIYNEYGMNDVHSCYDFILENIYYEVRDDIRRRIWQTNSIGK